VDPERLKHARIRPARSDDDVARVSEFLQTPRVGEIVDGHPEERGAVRICEIDGKIVAALLLDPSPLPVRGLDVRCARILETGGEDGRIRFRETGDRELFEFMLEEALGYVWVKRYPISFAHGELALYPEHGFVPCYYHPRVYVGIDAALALPHPYRVRRFKHDDVRHVAKLRARNRRWKPSVFSIGVPPFHHFCIENPEREVRGYFSLRVKQESKWSPKLFAPESEVVDRAAACTLLHHCAEKGKELGLEEMHFPLGAGHPVARLCLELGGRAILRGAATDPRVDEEMIHLVDPPRLVAALRPALEPAIGKDETATIPFLTNSGCWALRIADGAIAFPPLDRRPEGVIQLPHWKLTQLLTGYRGVDELDVGLNAAQAELLTRLFPKTWPQSLSDPDHWEPVVPPRPYCDAAAAIVGDVRLPWARA